MLKAPLRDETGAARGEVELPEEIFGVAPHAAVVHEVLAWQLAGRRLGTRSTKTRGEVRGGGRKPWRQKGTGRARHGSRRSPLWIGGGIVFGPRPAVPAYALPKRVRRLAVRSVLADKLRRGLLTVVEALPLEGPRTKDLAALLARLDAGGEKVLLVTPASNQTLVKAAANLPGVRVLTARTLNVHDLLAYPRLVVTREALAVVNEVWGE
jgi:large subunit ribosomal protein L4